MTSVVNLNYFIVVIPEVCKRLLDFGAHHTSELSKRYQMPLHLYQVQYSTSLHEYRSKYSTSFAPAPGLTTREFPMTNVILRLFKG